jgi:3-hydroxyisobutyrate dehydrogenase
MKVGFIGLGTMGGPMALNAQKGGHDLIVNDLRRDCAKPHLERGARWADSARDIASEADVILTSLPGPREVEAMSEDILQAMRKDAAWFDLSPNSVTVV